MPSGSKPLPESMLIQIASLGRNELSKVVTAAYFNDTTFTEYILRMIVNEYIFFLTYKTFRQTPEYLFCWVKFHTACDGQTPLTFTALILPTNKPNRFSGYIANSLASRRCGFNLKLYVLRVISKMDIFSISCEISLGACQKAWLTTSQLWFR